MGFSLHSRALTAVFRMQPIREIHFVYCFFIKTPARTIQIAQFYCRFLLYFPYTKEVFLMNKIHFTVILFSILLIFPPNAKNITLLRQIQ